MSDLGSEIDAFAAYMKSALREKDLEIVRLRKTDLTAEVLALKAQNARLKRQLDQSNKHIKGLQISLKAITESRRVLSSQVERQSSLGTEETRLESSPPYHPAEVTIKEEEVESVQQAPNDEGNDENWISLSSLVARQWHPNDFMVNPAIEGVPFAFQEKALGKRQRSKLNCTDCRDCQAFYALTGIKVTKSNSSRHREQWSKQDTPPGFWRSGFDSLEENQDKQEIEKLTRVDALKRLHEAIHSGQYLFKNPELRKKAELGLIKS